MNIEPNTFRIRHTSSTWIDIDLNIENQQQVIIHFPDIDQGWWIDFLDPMSHTWQYPMPTSLNQKIIIDKLKPYINFLKTLNRNHWGQKFPLDLSEKAIETLGTFTKLLC